MKFLLDTCTFLWMIASAEKLSVRAKEVIVDGGNQLFLSSVSSLEIAIKLRSGKLEFTGDPQMIIPEHMAQAGVESLPMTHAHALYVTSLPYRHRDPFDRVLVAQAKLEELVLLSPDPALHGYAVECVW